MKLHLPKCLLTALICAVLAGNITPAMAGQLTTGSFTLPVGGGTYTFSGTAAIKSNYDEEKAIGTSGTLFTVGGTTYNGAASTANGPFIADSSVEAGQGADNFWKNLTNRDGAGFTGNVYGQTLLMTGSYTATQQLNNNGMGNMAIGGLITEDTAATTESPDDTSNYILNGASGNSNLTLVANESVGMNMYIGANTEIKVGGTGQLIAATDGTWTVNSGKTLTMTAGADGAVVFQSGISVQGGGTLSISDGLTFDGGSITVANGSTLHMTGTVDIISHASGAETARDRANGNGFGHAEYSANASDYIKGDGTVNLSEVSWSINGYDASLSGNTLSYTGDNDTYYIYNAAEAADYSSATHLVVDIETGSTYDFGSSANTTLKSISIRSGTMTSGYAGGQIAFMQGDIDIGAGAELKFTGGHDMLGWSNTNTKTISLTGEEGNVAKLTFAYSGDGSATMKTNLYLQGHTLVSGGKVNSLGGNITATGTNNVFASGLQVRNNLTVNVQNASDFLTISGEITSNSNGQGVLTKSGEGHLYITGNLNLSSMGTTINGTDINQTTISSASIQNVTIQNATLSSLTGQNLSGTVNLSNIELDSILTVANGGTLTLTGSVDIATNVAAESGTEVARTRENGNGFASGTYSVNISDYITGDGSVNTSGVTGWSLNGNNVTKGEDNTLSYTGEGRNTYYIYNATEAADYGKAKHLVVDVEMGNTYDFGTSANTTLESMTIKSGKVTSSYADGDTTGNAFMRGDIIIEAGAELELTGEHDALGWSPNAPTKSISLEGDAHQTANLTFSCTDGGSTTMTTNLNLKGYALVSGGTLNTYGGTITATGTDNIFASTLELREALTVDVTGSSDSLLISGNIVSNGYAEYTGALTKTGAGQLEISGTINGGNKHTINGGNTTTISSASIQDVTIHNAKLSSESGQNLSGTVNLTNVTLVGTMNITGGTTTYTAGMLQFEGDAATVTISRGATLAHDGFNFTANGTEAATIQGGGQSSLHLFDGNNQLSNAALTKTTDGDKYIGVALDNVDLTLNNADNRLYGNKSQSLHNLTVNGGTLGVESAATVSGTTTVADGAKVTIKNTAASLGSVTGAGTVESEQNATVNTATGFTGTLAAKGNSVLTDAGAGSGFDVDATAGDLVLLNRDTEITLNSATLAGGHSLTIGTETAHDITLNLTTLTVGEGGGTLNANLNLTGTATLDISSALTLGCSVDLGDGGVALSGSVLDGLAANGYVELFTGVDELTHNGAAYSEPISASEVFSNEALRDTADINYTVAYENNAVMLKSSLIPEPTTATLSLLALMGLAARRRRK